MSKKKRGLKIERKNDKIKETSSAEVSGHHPRMFQEEIAKQAKVEPGVHAAL